MKLRSTSRIERRRASRARDIAFRLPLELIIPVVPHVHPVDIVVFQMVSKRWRDVFSSPDVYRACLKFHFQLDPETILLPGEKKESGAEKEPVLKVLKRTHALCTGRPYSRAQYKFSVDRLLHGIEPTVDYAHRRLAWIDSRRRNSVNVLCLTSGVESLFRCSQRVGQFYNVVLSNKMMAAVTRLTMQGPTHCVVAWLLETHEERAFKLSSNEREIEQIGSREDKLVIAFQGGTVMVWDFRSCIRRTVHLPSVLLVSLCPNEDRLLIVIAEYDAQESDGNPHSSITAAKFTKWTFVDDSLSRECEEEDEPDVSLPLDASPYIGFLREQSVRAGHPLTDLASFSLWAALPALGSREWEWMTVSYDWGTNTACAGVSVDHPRRGTPYQRLIFPLFPPGAHYNMYTDSNVLFRGDPSFLVNPPPGWRAPPSESDTGGLGIWTEMCEFEAANRKRYAHRNPPVLDLFGDPALLGIVSPQGVRVWSFEEDLVLSHETRRYRYLRKRRAGKRRRVRKLNASKNNQG